MGGRLRKIKTRGICSGLIALLILISAQMNLVFAAFADQNESSRHTNESDLTPSETNVGDFSNVWEETDAENPLNIPAGAEERPETSAGGVSETTAEKNTEAPAETAAEGISEETAETAPEGISEETAKTAPEGISEETAEATPEGSSEETAETTAGSSSDPNTEPSAGEIPVLPIESSASDERIPAAETTAEAERNTPSNAIGEELTATSSNAITLKAPILPEEGCTTIDDLINWISEGNKEITLSNDIILERDIYYAILAEEPVTVNMNGFRIIVPDEGRLMLGGSIHFTGTAQNAALFEINGTLEIINSGVEITAEGEKATALILSEHSVFLTSENKDLRINVSGTGSTAIFNRRQNIFDSTIVLNYVYITAEGKNSVGIDSVTPLFIRMCRIEAQGEEIICDNEISVYNSRVQSIPAHAETAESKFYLAERYEQNGLSVLQGAGLEELYDQLPDAMYYVLYDSESKQELWGDRIKGTWSGVPADLTITAMYTAVFEPDPWPEWLDGFISPLSEVSVPVYVVAPNKPHIQEIFRMEQTISFRFLTEILSYDSLTLLFSANDGESWQDAADVPDLEFVSSGNLAAITGLPMDQVYLFKISVSGGPMAGTSIAVPFYYFENDSDRYGHGDRDGDGRGDQGETLPPPIPPLWPAVPGDNNDSDSGGEVLPNETADRDSNKHLFSSTTSAVPESTFPVSVSDAENAEDLQKSAIRPGKQLISEFQTPALAALDTQTEIHSKAESGSHESDSTGTVRTVSIIPLSEENSSQNQPVPVSSGRLTRSLMVVWKLSAAPIFLIGGIWILKKGGRK